MKATHFYTFIYNEKNPERMRELVFSILKNMQEGFDTFTLFVESSDIDMSVFLDNKNVNSRTVVNLRYTGKRTTFNNVMQVMAENEDKMTEYWNKGDVYIVANTDIYVQDLKKIVEYFQANPTVNGKPTALALSRWDMQGGQPFHFHRADSQDTWAFVSAPRFQMEQDFGFGIAGCDNRFAYELMKAGYEPVNPSKSIKTLHFHESGVRNYIDQNGVVIGERVPNPYLLIEPSI